MMTIQNLNLKNIGRISKLTLTFGPGLNLICGPNGIGKTTILESIGYLLSITPTTNIRKRAGSDLGELQLMGANIDGPYDWSSNIEYFTPTEKAFKGGHHRKWAKWVITIKTNRRIDYLNLSKIGKDPEDDSGRYQNLPSVGTDFKDIKNWFINRFLFSSIEGSVTDEQKSNLLLAKEAFSELDPYVTFHKVDAASFDLIVKTQCGEIYYEYLSAGFKSCLCLILGLIKEIEYRFRSPYIKAKDFNGVIVADELDLHLHPEWQPKIIHVLKHLFPKAQIIAATHSPHMIQAASANEIIALECTEQGEVFQRELPQGDFGFQGWTVEEILTDVMGMQDTRSTKYRELESDFEKALEQADTIAAQKAFDLLDKFLHPSNIQRKLFKIQLTQLQGENA